MDARNSKPPKLARRLLLSFLRDDLEEEVLGDLEQKFYTTLNKESPLNAKLGYWSQVFQYIRPFAIRKFKLSSNNITMFQSYFKIGWRNLFKQKGYSFINIGGLAAGMAVAMLIGLWIYDELAFNKYHKNYDRIAKVMYRITMNNDIGWSHSMPLPLAPALLEQYKDDFEHVVMSSPASAHIVANGELKFTKSGRFMQADAGKMLTLRMKGGTPDGLHDVHSIMISESLARTMFGDEDPINKILKIDNKADVKVTGVYEDLPKNSEFKDVAFIASWDLYFAMNEWLKGFENAWSSGVVHIFVQIPRDRDMDLVSLKVINTIQERVRPEERVHKFENFLHPMSKWHLYNDFKDGISSGGQIRFVWLFGIIGVFVLSLACINFMNLSTARSERRAREVGVRKAIGSLRGQLIRQFFAESLLVVMIGFVFSLGMVMLALPWFNGISDKEISFPWSSSLFWISCIGFVLVTGIVAGSYPALYLSSFSAVKVLKGTFRAGRFASVPRKALVVLQFTVSITLIVGTVIVYQQIQHAKDRPVGYSREGLIFVNMRTNEIHDHFEVVRNQLISAGAILDIAESNNSIVKKGTNLGGMDWKGKKPGFSDNFDTEWVSPEYGKTLGWQLVAGRDFSRDIASDRNGIIINESAAKYMGMDRPVGEIVRRENQSWTILGVVKDMINGSPYQSTRQAIYFPLGWPGNVVSLKINPEQNIHQALPKIEAVFRAHVPSMPFDYHFADEEYARKFHSEVRVGQLASIFAGLAISISCFGLFGLASFVAEQRGKEIGIRKIAGASGYQVWGMLCKDFVLLVLISCIIAIPLSYYYLNEWLSQYEYRTVMSWWIFPLTVALALSITLLTVSLQAVRAALINPVKSLRSE
ncbi:MAG TPA: ABC transporter permease [Chryseolinea sp.]